MMPSSVIHYKGHLVYEKEVIPSKHFMVIFKGYGSSVKLLEDMKRNNVHIIMITQRGRTGTVKKWAYIDDYLKSPLKYTDSSQGFEDSQVFLPWNSMKDMGDLDDIQLKL